MKFAIMTHIALPEGKDPKQRLMDVFAKEVMPHFTAMSGRYHGRGRDGQRHG